MFGHSRGGIVNRLSIFALVLSAGVWLSFSSPATLVGADLPVPAVGATWEFRAVSFGTDEKESTKKLNELAAAGWEYVGPLANSMVAFKRRVIPVPPPPGAKEEKVESKEYKDVLIVSSFLAPPLVLPGADPRTPPERDTRPDSACVAVKVAGKTIELTAERGTTQWYDSWRRSGEVVDSLSGLANVRADITTKKTETREVITLIRLK
jgi:hypothetical protein